MIDYQNTTFTESDFEKKKKELGEESFHQAAKYISLKVLDTLWQDHLNNMEHMRESVKLRAYGGHDPLVEYKREGRRLFDQLLQEIDSTIGENILKAGVHTHNQAHVHESSNFAQNIAQQRPPSNTQHLTPNTQIGRNDPCPCGSGKKFKKCGMLNTEEHQKLMSENNV